MNEILNLYDKIKEEDFSKQTNLNFLSYSDFSEEQRSYLEKLVKFSGSTANKAVIKS